MKSNVFKVNRLKEQSYRNTGTHNNQRVGSYSNTDHKVDQVNKVIREELAHRIAQKSANAGLSNRRSFYYYKRKNNGRRCSCFGEEISPDSDCGVCLGTGYVGGYDKFGTHLEVIDFTKNELFGYNTNIDFDVRTLGFSGKKDSYLEFDVNIPRNKGVDSYELGVDNHKNFRLEAIEPISKVINSGLDFNGLEGKCKFRLIFLNESYFQHIHLRFKILDDIIVYGDCSNYNSSPSSEMFGEFEAMNEIDITFTGMSMKLISNKDILYRLEDGAKLKITDNNKIVVSQVLTSIDAKARFLISTDKIEKKLII